MILEGVMERRDCAPLPGTALDGGWRRRAAFYLRTLARHQPLAKAALLVAFTVLYRIAVKAPLELLRLRPALAWAELRAAAAGAGAALRAFSDRSPSRR